MNWAQAGTGIAILGLALAMRSWPDLHPWIRPVTYAGVVVTVVQAALLRSLGRWLLAVATFLKGGVARSILVNVGVALALVGLIAGWTWCENHFLPFTPHTSVIGTDVYLSISRHRLNSLLAGTNEDVKNRIAPYVGMRVSLDGVPITPWRVEPNDITMTTDTVPAFLLRFPPTANFVLSHRLSGETVSVNCRIASGRPALLELDACYFR